VGDGGAFQTSFQGGITAEEDTADIAMGTVIAEIFPGVFELSWWVTLLRYQYLYHIEANDRKFDEE
jgi:hypothetical protein